MGEKIHRFKGWLNFLNSDNKIGHVFTSQRNYGLAGVFQDNEQRPKTWQDANDLLAPGFSSCDAFAAITTMLSSTGGVRFSAHQLNMTRLIQQKRPDVSKLELKRGGVGKLYQAQGLLEKIQIHIIFKIATGIIWHDEKSVENLYFLLHYWSHSVMFRILFKYIC